MEHSYTGMPGQWSLRKRMVTAAGRYNNHLLPLGAGTSDGSAEKRNTAINDRDLCGAADYIDEGRIHAITESVQRRIGHLQELAMTQTPRQLDTTEDDVREEVAADYAPKMEL